MIHWRRCFVRMQQPAVYASTTHFGTKACPLPLTGTWHLRSPWHTGFARTRAARCYPGYRLVCHWVSQLRRPPAKAGTPATRCTDGTAPAVAHKRPRPPTFHWKCAKPFRYNRTQLYAKSNTAPASRSGVGPRVRAVTSARDRVGVNTLTGTPNGPAPGTYSPPSGAACRVANHWRGAGWARRRGGVRMSPGTVFSGPGTWDIHRPGAGVTRRVARSNVAGDAAWREEKRGHTFEWN